MSSHHFVKEGQEPALLIIDAVSFEVAGSLLEWAPLVMVAEPALDEVLAWGIKMDVVFSTTENQTLLAEKLLHQAPLKIIPFHSFESPFKAGLQYLMDNNQQHVNVLAKVSDELFSGIENVHNSFHVILLNQEVKWTLHEKFEKWLPAKTSLYIRKTQPSQKVLFQGLLNHEFFAETISDGVVKVNSAALFWVGEPL